MNLNKIGSIETDVKVTTLVEALQMFRAEHVEDYAESMNGYRKAFAERAKAAARDVRKAEPGKFRAIPENFGLVVPVDNTKMYDNFINAFKSASSDTLSLSIEELHTIINNSWDWIAVSSSSFSSYNSKFAA